LLIVIEEDDKDVAAKVTNVVAKNKDVACSSL